MGKKALKIVIEKMIADEPKNTGLLKDPSVSKLLIEMVSPRLNVLDFWNYITLTQCL